MSYHADYDSHNALAANTCIISLLVHVLVYVAASGVRRIFFSKGGVLQLDAATPAPPPPPPKKKKFSQLPRHRVGGSPYIIHVHDRPELESKGGHLNPPNTFGIISYSHKIHPHAQKCKVNTLSKYNHSFMNIIYCLPIKKSNILGTHTEELQYKHQLALQCMNEYNKIKIFFAYCFMSVWYYDNLHVHCILQKIDKKFPSTVLCAHLSRIYYCCIYSTNLPSSRFLCVPADVYHRPCVCVCVFSHT